MRLLVLLALVLGIGLIVLSLAIRWQAPELSATEIPVEPVVAAPEENAAAEGAETESRPEETAAPEPAQLPPVQPVNATRQACLALEDRLLDELDDAEQAFNRAKKEYDSAQEAYEDSVGTADDATVDRLREERDDTKEEFENSMTALERVTKRLSRARIECGLYQ
jgi:hypothetical protein